MDTIEKFIKKILNVKPRASRSELAKQRKLLRLTRQRDKIERETVRTLEETLDAFQLKYHDLLDKKQEMLALKEELEANITFHQAGITSDDDPTIPVSFNALEAERYLRDEFPSQIAAIDKKLFLFKCQMQDVQMKCDNMRSENGKTQEQIREVEENIEWIMGELKRRGQLAAEEEAAAAAGAGASDDDEEHEEDLDLESRMATVPAAQIMDDEDDDAAVGSDSGHGHGDASEEEEAEEREGKCAGAPLLQPPAEPSAARQSVVVLQAPVDVDAAPIVMESAGPVV